MSTATLADAFVTLADTLAEDFDRTRHLDRVADACVRHVNVAAARVLLAESDSGWQAVAATSGRHRSPSVMQVPADHGPCAESLRSGAQVHVPELTAIAHRWPVFADAARRAGFAAVHALPLRLRDETIGAVGLFHRSPGPLNVNRLRIGQALVDVATIGLVQERAARAREERVRQLQVALTSRIVIEQAKGVVAERLRVDAEHAFALLRKAARSENRRLSDLCRSIVDGTDRGLTAGSHGVA